MRAMRIRTWSRAMVAVGDAGVGWRRYGMRQQWMPSLCPMVLRCDAITHQQQRRGFSSSVEMDTTTRFRNATYTLQSSTEVPVTNETKLKLYALFKQVESGPCTGSRPGMLDVVGRAKYDAWKALGSMDKETAMKQYIKAVSELLGEIKAPPGAAAAAASPPPAAPAAASAAVGSPSVVKLTMEEVLFPRRTPSPADEAQLASFQSVKVSRSADYVATVSLNRPSKSNSFDYNMWEELRCTWEHLSKDSRVRSVVLHGVGNNFSTGMDVSVFLKVQEMASKSDCDARKREGLKHFIDFLQRAVSGAETVPVPVIAAVHGRCIGGAIDLICAADLRYCTHDAIFCVKEIDLAIVADLGTLQRLPKLIGHQRAAELCYTGRTFTGREAQEVGLVVKSFETVDQMMAHVKEVASTIAQKSPLTVRGVKRGLLFARDHSVEEGLEHVQMWNSSFLLSNDLATAVSAVMTKQPPVFKED